MKVDSKTKTVLDDYKKKKRQELAKKAANDTTAFKFIYEDDEDDEDNEQKKGNSTEGEGKKKSGEEGEIEEEEDDYLDEATRVEDHKITQSLETVMREYAREMNQRALEAKEVAMRETQVGGAPGPGSSPVQIPLNIPPPPIPSGSTPPSEKSNAGSLSPNDRRVDPQTILDDEEGKRHLISNEIEKFRDRFKDEDTKMRNTEKERKDRYERERAAQREKRLAEEAATNRNRQSSKSPSKNDSSPTSRDRSPPHRDRHSNRADRSSPSDDRRRSSMSRNHSSNSVRSRTNDRRSPPPSRHDRRSPPPPPSRTYNRRSRTRSPVPKNHSHDEDDDEAYERKRQDRRMKEKELHYRELLKKWEQRERRKASEYEEERRREIARLRDEENEAKRTLEFLEDYKDEAEDTKHYKGFSLTRKLKDRDSEIGADKRDSRHEKQEIEELRQKLLLQNNITDIEAEIKRHLEKEEETIRRRMADLIRTTTDDSTSESDNEENHVPEKPEENVTNGSVKVGKNIETNENKPRSLTKSGSPKPVLEHKTSPNHTSALGGAPITGTKLPFKRKLAVNEAFRDDAEEDAANNYQKKSKLSLPEQSIGESSPQTKEDASRLTPGKSNSNNAEANALSAQAQEEKRQAVRKLIESIPTKKEELFTYPLDWSLLDTTLMEKRIKPWVVKKIVEYIGEEEPSLTEFICLSVTSKKSAEAILTDIRVVLDDEAEVFVVKMWRLIVYEIEAKRKGLSK